MDVSEHVRKMLESQKKTLELTMKYGNSEDLNLDRVLKMALDTCHIDMLNAAALDAINMAAATNTEEEFDEVFTRNSQIDCSTESISRYRLYKDFEQYARHLALNKAGSTTSRPLTQTTTVGNDMEITETSQAIDPLTKGPLLRPVRNLHCNHIYGYQSVMDSLSINRRLRCPMIGCLNKEYIIPEHLVEI